MRTALTAAIDRRLEHLVVARARRREPLLHLVPARWIVVVARPAVPRLRRSLALAALTGAAITLPLAVLLLEAAS